MRGLWPLLGAGSWLSDLFHARTLAIILWSGFGVLTVALFILMRTRWGQAKPISKCIVLSVLAHSLLLGCAYTTQLFTQPVVRESKFKLKMLRASEVDSPADESPAETAPWDQFVGESATPDLLAPDRVETGDVDDVARPTRSQLPQVVDVPRAAPETSLVRPLPDDDASERIPPIDEVAQATQIEVPAAEPATPDTSVAAIPDSPALKRRTTDDDVPQILPERPKPEAGADVAAQVQQLANVDVRPEAAPTASAQEDELPRVNPEESPGHPTAASRPDNPRREAPDDRTPDGTEDAQSLVSVDRGAESSRPRASATRPRRLGDGAPMPTAYRLRTATQRAAAARQRGGDDRTEAAVEAALAWLAASQSRDGRWDASAHGAGVENRVLGHDRQGAGIDADTGITGLALLAFLGAGHTHLEGEYRERVKRGLEFLVRSQAGDGNLFGDASLFAMMYCHGMATLALAEALAMTGDPQLKPYVERAVEYTLHAQHPTSGGWRYQPGDQGDMSQFGWQVMALRSARLAGIEIPERTQAGMVRFLESAMSRSQPGLAAYRPGERVTQTMTAEATTCRFFLDLPRQGEIEQQASAFILKDLPGSGQGNLYYWYYASLAMYHIGGDAWKDWNAALVPQLLDRQRTEGAEAGSWDTNTVWGSYGGRVYTTSLATLCLETYYRYLPDESGSEWMPRDRTSRRAASP